MGFSGFAHECEALIWSLTIFNQNTFILGEVVLELWYTQKLTGQLTKSINF